MSEDKTPHVHKVGRYLFYGVCAFAVSVLVGVTCKRFNASELVISAASYVAMFVTFMTLRDMDKNDRTAPPPPKVGE